jgi:hypothetical protein
MMPPLVHSHDSDPTGTDEPLHTYRITGTATIYFELKVDAPSEDQARIDVSEMSLFELTHFNDSDEIEIYAIEDLGPAHPSTP